MVMFGIRYTERAQLKIYNRVVPSYFSLGEDERTVLLFILQRTVGWRRAWELISPKEFQNGAFRRKFGKRTLVIRGTGLPTDRVAQAIRALSKIGAIEVCEIGTKTAYRIVEDWCHADLEGFGIWGPNDNDYLYDEDEGDCE